MRPGIVIRDFEARDQEAARALILAGLGEHFGHIDPSLNPDLDDVAGQHAGADLVVAERNGAIVGTGFLRQASPGSGEIVRMSVDAHQRRTGVGRAILDELLQRARARGYGTVMLSTLGSWDDAVGFYSSCGFRERQRVAVARGVAVTFEMTLQALG